MGPHACAFILKKKRRTGCECLKGTMLRVDLMDSKDVYHYSFTEATALIFFMFAVAT